MTQQTDTSQTLLDTTLAMLADVWGGRPGQGGLTAAQIADGAGVRREWLRKLAHGHIANPGVIGIQKVHDFLASRQVRLTDKPRRGAAE